MYVPSLRCKSKKFALYLAIVASVMMASMGGSLSLSAKQSTVTSTTDVSKLKLEAISDAIHLLKSIGVKYERLCHPSSEAYEPHLKKCVDIDESAALETPLLRTVRQVKNCRDPQNGAVEKFTNRPQYLRRFLGKTAEEATPIANDGQNDECCGSSAGGEEAKDSWFYISNSIYAFICICTAALAAGLTVGMLSLDPLLLLIKMRAGATEKERQQAAKILPIVKQRHLLLVTLLLMNSLANEALPLFLEGLVSPLVSVILSVTIVLFFGEIIPSAIFAGPNKVALASRLTPVVRIVIFFLYPIAFPIAKTLDHVLHEDEDGDGGGGALFNRGELRALVRIQYEERMAAKKRQKEEQMRLHTEVHKNEACQRRPSRVSNGEHVGSLDFTPPLSLRASAKAARRENQRRQESFHSSVTSTTNATGEITTSPSALASTAAHMSHARRHSNSIHIDEVSMVEGALQMKTKMAMDVFTPIHQVFSIPYDLKLTERNIVHIYSSGYSRIPVYEPNPNKPKNHQAIRGLLMTKQLIVVDKDDARPVSTLPLFVPICVSPKINLVDMLNLFQTGKVGHMALVCARPEVAREALMEDEPLPESAGLMGIITIEDVIEELLQEEIYDESDKQEREARRISKWAFRKWKKFSKKKKLGNVSGKDGKEPMSSNVGDVVVDFLSHGADATAAGEGTPLLGEESQDDSSKQSKSGGLLGIFGL